MIRFSSSCTWKWIEYLVGDSRGLHLATIFELVYCGTDCSADNERSNDVSRFAFKKSNSLKFKAEMNPTIEN